MATLVRQLLPHVSAMIALYILFVILLALITGHDDFWSSLLIAMIIAFGYPPIVRRLGWAPEAWQR